MRNLFPALLLLVLGSTAVHAEDYYGKLVATPAVIKVLSNQEFVEEYKLAPEVNTGSFDATIVRISQNGAMAMCGSSLGQLAEDYVFTVELANGVRKTATIRAAAGRQRNVAVFGMCQKGTNILDQLYIQVNKGSGIEVQ